MRLCEVWSACPAHHLVQAGKCHVASVGPIPSPDIVARITSLVRSSLRSPTSGFTDLSPRQRGHSHRWRKSWSVSRPQQFRESLYNSLSRSTFLRTHSFGIEFKRCVAVLSRYIGAVSVDRSAKDAFAGVVASSDFSVQSMSRVDWCVIVLLPRDLRLSL